jgi:hypothetical protein
MKTMKQFNLEGECMGYKKITLALVAGMVLLAGVSFYAGAKYEKVKLSKLGLLVDKKSQVKETKVKKQPVAAEVQGPKIETLEGKIAAKTATTLTITLADGKKQEVLLTPEVKIGENGTGKIAQLFVGQQISVSGLRNPEGTFAAQEIKPIAAAQKTTTATKAPSAPKLQ